MKLHENAEALLRERYGPPIVDTAKMVAFRTPLDRHVALQKDVSSLALWMEDSDDLPSAPGSARTYAANEGRHSNLPARLKHDGPEARRVVRFMLPGAEDMEVLLDKSEGRSGSRSALERLKQRFLAAFPDFATDGGFAAISGKWHETYRRQVDVLLTSVQRHPTDGWSVLQDLITASQGGRGALPPFFEGDVSWRISRIREIDAESFDSALNNLITDNSNPAKAIEQFNETFWSLLKAIGESSTFRDTRIVPSAVLAATNPDANALIRYTPYHNAERIVNGRVLFKNKPIVAGEYRAVLALTEQIRSAMIEWGWKPRDLWDVHGFILTTCGVNREQDAALTDEELLAKFDGHDDFREGRAQLTSEQSTAFCRMARAAHDAGLDWYHVPNYPARFGRKEGGKPAKATLGSANAGEAQLSYHQERTRNAGIEGTFDFDAKGADAFIQSLQNSQQTINKLTGPSRERAGRWPDEYEVEDDDNMNDARKTPAPTNLILYGPPGTGKTYRTASEAVRLCDGAIDYPDDNHGRAALMARYNELVESERIAFVTFHQNFSYEEFVEGLRPSVPKDGSAGFSLRPRDGIFKRIAKHAGAERATEPELVGKTAFRMSQGELGVDDWVYEEAIETGSLYLGFANIDWSDEKYADRAEIVAALNRQEHGEVFTNQSGAVKATNCFRNKLQMGDLIIVSKGTTLFRAIGVVTGKYQYAPRVDGTYCHRRDIEWLWNNPAGVPHETLQSQKFGIDTINQLDTSAMDLENLIELIEGHQYSRMRGGSSGSPYVLIIDEINRANVSKVFGELITLIEPDKRFGMANELTVRLPYSKRQFGVPANLHIVGTMNTADRSIMQLDTALRRRFRFEEMAPKPELLEKAGGIDLPAVLRTINERIEYLLDRDHTVGHSFFMGEGGRDRTAIDETMRYRVIPLLQEYFFEDWSRIHAVLGSGFVESRVLNAPPGLDDQYIVEKRSSWSIRKPFAKDAYETLLKQSVAQSSGSKLEGGEGAPGGA